MSQREEEEEAGGICCSVDARISSPPAETEQSLSSPKVRCKRYHRQAKAARAEIAAALHVSSEARISAICIYIAGPRRRCGEGRGFSLSYMTKLRLAPVVIAADGNQPHLNIETAPPRRRIGGGSGARRRQQ